MYLAGSNCIFCPINATATLSTCVCNGVSAIFSDGVCSCPTNFYSRLGDCVLCVSGVS